MTHNTQHPLGASHGGLCIHGRSGWPKQTGETFG
jgi:hypothetical protein